MLDARLSGAIYESNEQPFAHPPRSQHVLRITHCSLQLSRRDEHSEVCLPNY